MRPAQIQMDLIHVHVVLVIMETGESAMETDVPMSTNVKITPIHVTAAKHVLILLDLLLVQVQLKIEISEKSFKNRLDTVAYMYAACLQHVCSMLVYSMLVYTRHRKNGIDMGHVTWSKSGQNSDLSLHFFWR